MNSKGNDKWSQWRIGDLLVKEGFLKSTDIEKALEIQTQDTKKNPLPFGKALVKRGSITQDQLVFLTNHPEIQVDIGRLAVERGLIGNDQLAACLRNRVPEEPLGEALLRKGYITEEHMEVLVEEQQNSPKLGDLAVKLGMINEKDLEDALRILGATRTIGEILCDLSMIDPLDLNNVLKKYGKQLTIGEFLLKQGVIDEGKLKVALQEQRHRAEPLGRIMLQKKLINTDQLYFALSRQYNIPFEKMEGFVLSKSDRLTLSSIVGRKYSEKNQILPLSLEGNRLTLAISNPENTRALEDLKQVFSHLRMNCVLITEEKFEDHFEALYGRALEGTKTWLGKIAPSKNFDHVEIDLEGTDLQLDKVAPYGISDMETEELVNFIIKYGIMNDASDIHVEQDRNGARLRYRIDGVLQPLKLRWLDEKLQEMVGAIISRIKVMSNLDITERRVPQDGVFRVTYFDKAKKRRFDLDFRVATCPAIVGENINIRILDAQKVKVSLHTLGHSQNVLEPLKRLLKSSAGMVLVSGPTGSGKSSTLYSALQFIYHPSIKIITAEDPIEYSFPGIMQTQVNPKINLTFARLLRSFLRLDPDVILVGEIRDEETAGIGFDAAQTGHLLLSTIHTNDSFTAIPRLLDLNIEYNQIASCLMGVLAQRLVRKICDSCKEQYRPSADEWGILFRKYPEHLKFYRGKGCDSCDYTGYNGRTLISELLLVDREIARVLNRGGSESEVKDVALEKGMKTMLDDGLSKLDQTALSEIIRVVPHEMIKELRSRKSA